MKESLQEARDELKRIDHQIYVSLKYTRTVDVLMNTISRMIDAYTCLVDTLLKFSVEKNNVKEDDIPKTPLERGHLVVDLFKEEAIVHKNMDLYFLLRKVIKTNPKKEQEFRRHVTLTSLVDGQEVKVDIDIATEYYNQIKEFFEWVSKKTDE